MVVLMLIVGSAERVYELPEDRESLRCVPTETISLRIESDISTGGVWELVGAKPAPAELINGNNGGFEASGGMETVVYQVFRLYCKGDAQKGDIYPFMLVSRVMGQGEARESLQLVLTVVETN